MADIAFTCPECGHAYQFASHLAGKRGRCKTCQAVFRIPAAAPTSASRPAAHDRSRHHRDRLPSPHRLRRPLHPRRCVPRMRRRSSSTARPAGTATAWTRNWPGNRAGARAAAASSRSPRDPARRAWPPPTRLRRHRQRRAAELERPPASPRRGRLPLEPHRGRPPPAPARWQAAVPRSRRPQCRQPAAGDSGWWELDSSESIPATDRPAGAGRSRAPPRSRRPSRPSPWQPAGPG